MEVLNTIEKMTLLVSTGIVCLANLFVMLERAKKSEQHLLHTIIQKLLGLKNTFFVFCLIVAMSSCSSGKFLNRKYTIGRFAENVKSLKHNSICVDTTKLYSSLNNPIEFKKSSVILNAFSGKDIINQKVESNIKKDSIFIFNGKGRNKTVVVKNDLLTVVTHIDRNGKRVKSKIVTPIVAEKIKKNQIAKIKAFSIMSLCFALIPVLGFAFAITAKKLIKQSKKTNPFPYIDHYNVISNVGLGLSIIPSLIFVCAAVFLIFAIIMFALGSSAMAVIPI
jgi:hypothetical protein